MPELSSRTERFTDSVIRRMTRVANQYGAVNLSQGFPDFAPPKELTDRLAEVAQSGPHQYALTCGAQNFREALAKKYEHFSGMKINSDTEIVVTCGSTEAMILCNPSNPCEKVFSREELMLIAELAIRYDLFVITDEVYEHILYEPYEHIYMASLPGMKERTIICNSLSKTYSIIGWRLGYAIACPVVTDRIKKVHDFLTVGAASPLMEAAVAGLNFGNAYYDWLKKKYTHMKELYEANFSSTNHVNTFSYSETLVCYMQTGVFLCMALAC